MVAGQWGHVSTRFLSWGRQQPQGWRSRSYFMSRCILTFNESCMSSLARSEEKHRCPRRPPAPPPFFVSWSQMRSPSWELSCLTAVCLSDLRASLLCRVGPLSRHPLNSCQRVKVVQTYKGTRVKRQTTANLDCFGLSWFLPLLSRTPCTLGPRLHKEVNWPRPHRSRS